MKFIIQESQKDQHFSLVYRDEEYSFDIEPYYEIGFTAIMINDLQLEIDDEGRIGYVWGLCPLIQYEETREFPGNYISGSLVVLLNKPIIPGVSHRLNENERWPIYINKKMGWVCIGNPEIKNKQLVEFAPNCVAALEEQEITAVWLHPETLPEF